MARMAGKSGAFQIDATVPADPKGVTSWELDYECDETEVTGMDSSGAAEYLATITNAQGTAKMFGTDDAQNPVTNTEIRPGLTCTAYLFHQSGDAACWHGTCFIKSVKPTVNVKGPVEYDVAFRFTGAVEYAAP